MKIKEATAALHEADKKGLPLEKYALAYSAAIAQAERQQRTAGERCKGSSRVQRTPTKTMVPP